jgi:tRNA 2-thiouridine synthesizing protein A
MQAVSEPSPYAGTSHAFLDARGLLCPLPLLKAKKIMNTLQSGQVLEVVATDPAALPDFKAFAAQTGHRLCGHTAMTTEKAMCLWIQKK